MIVDTIENASRYYMLHPSIEIAFEFLEDIDADNFAEGKTEIAGEHLFVNGIAKETQEFTDSVWESHEKYIDIHFMLEGKERIFYASEDSMKEITPYNYDKDATFFEGKGNEVCVPENGFVIFFPGEIHKAMVHTGKSEPVKKLVIKLGGEFE
ncbi:MAG: YhcH/YjgK/YiaL family protein [Cytophagaceae bacterium]|jgi:YhcH/YjgK/YiaL family protein|nr:YhcH/YjgK/YiaL family protein [Cytophagaceae bacterium]